MTYGKTMCPPPCCGQAAIEPGRTAMVIALMCQTRRSVRPSPHHFPTRQTQRNSFPLSARRTRSQLYDHLNPVRQEQSGYARLPHKIDNRPVFLSLLKMREVQISQFPSAEAAAKQDPEVRAVPLALLCWHRALAGADAPRPP